MIDGSAKISFGIMGGIVGVVVVVILGATEEP
jgi:hypothetical protein